MQAQARLATESTQKAVAGSMAQWSDEETRRLILLWGEEDVQCQLEGCKRNKAVYERLAQSMKPEYDRSGSQCREKIKKLKTEYKQIKDRNGKTGRGRKSMKFYEELNDILGTRPATRPAVLVDSGASTVTSAAGATEPTEGQDAAADDNDAQDPTPATAPSNDDTLPEQPQSAGKTTEGTTAKQIKPGKKRVRDELFEKAMETAMKKLAAASEESDKKYLEIEERRLRLEERAVEHQLQQRQEFQQMMLQALTRLSASSYPPPPPAPIGSYHYSTSNGSQYEQWTMQEGGDL